jgi:hypothetical protein
MKQHVKYEKVESIYDKVLRENNSEAYEKELENLKNYLDVRNSTRTVKVHASKPVAKKQIQKNPDVLMYKPQKIVKTPQSVLINYFSNSRPQKEQIMPQISDYNQNQNKKLSILQTSNIENDYLNFKTKFILKFASNAEIYDKIAKMFDITSHTNKKLMADCYKNIREVSDKRENILFDRMTNYLNKTPEDNIEFLISQIKECTVLFYEYEYFWLKLFEIFLKDYKQIKEENISFLRKTKDSKTILKNKEEENRKSNNFIFDNDNTHKSLMNGKKLKDINEIRVDYEKREKVNTMNVFRLEEE